jgi:RimJ/RimL family protein N-acetyltransferase
MRFPLETARLRLRLPEATDADFIRELVNDPTWLRFIGERNVRTREDAEAYLATLRAMHAAAGLGLATVEVRATGAAIGICGLLQRAELPEPDLGFAFLAAYRGQGYAREAAAAVLAAAWAECGGERILGLTHPANRASMTLLERLGFRRVGERQFPGVAWVSVVFALERVAPPASGGGATG